MPAEELFLWQAYDRISPISDDRADVLAGIIAAAPYQAQGMKVRPDELVPDWGAAYAPAKVAEEDGADAFQTYLMGLANGSNSNT
ncbi:hypothetical protein ACIPK7_05320 [Pseudomonas sp. NPDC086581]|uniref:phage tail assembly protein T n=1 Tax=Pseudomonas sp. NPDC086581 TaxID=3364432 RepID=UPI00382150FF